MGHSVKVPRRHEWERGGIIQPQYGTHILTDGVNTLLRFIGRGLLSQQRWYAVLAKVSRGIGRLEL